MDSIKVSLDNLFLDPNNFRLRSNPKYTELFDPTLDKIINKAIQERTKRLLIGKNGIDVKDVIDSLKTNGFLKVDNILVRKPDQNQEKYIVIEGNRRVAALKLLQESFKQGYDIGILNKSIFEDPLDNPNNGVDVVKYLYEKDEDYLILMALRHVSGNKKWDRYNQAKLIAELFEKKYSVEEITNRIGATSKQVVQQQLDAYYAITDYLGKKEFYESDADFNPHEKFMIFVEVLLKRNVKEYLGWDGTLKKFTNSDHLSRFYTWISPSTKFDFDDEDSDGEEFEKLPPIIVNHKQIRELDELITDVDSIEIMEDKRDIKEALEQNSGYTKMKFTSELKKSEKILKNVKFGVSLRIEQEDISVLTNIILLAKKILGSSEH